MCAGQGQESAKGCCVPVLRQGPLAHSRGPVQDTQRERSLLVLVSGPGAGTVQLTQQPSQGFILSHSWRVDSIMAGEPWRLEPEIFGHVASAGSECWC